MKAVARLLWLSLLQLALQNEKNSVVTAQVDNFPASRSPFFDIDHPQFVVLTFTDSVTTTSLSKIRPLTQILDPYACKLRFTFFVRRTEQTSCSLVKALEKGKHEIAVETIDGELADALNSTRAFLTNECGVQTEPAGFRYRNYDEETLRGAAAGGFSYDSSIVTGGTIGAYWPYTYSGDVPTCKCPLNTTLPLWEVPLSPIFDATGSLVTDVRDPTPVSLRATFNEHYNGNRAPLVMQLTSQSFTDSEDVWALRDWIEEVLAGETRDVHFVTVSQLLEYMQNPVDAIQYSEFCTGEADPCFTAIPMNCFFGSFNPNSCVCNCNQGYCVNAAGQCTETRCDEADGGWSAWDETAPCCGGKQQQTRSCTNPAPTGDGKDCEGEDARIENCFPEDCPNEGWGPWGDPQPCCEGVRLSSRECLAPPSFNDGRQCLGSDTQEEPCAPDECQKLFYPDYAKGHCFQSAFKPDDVDESAARATFEICCEVHFNHNLDVCYRLSSNPRIDGGWSPWQSSGACCNGREVTIRECSNPPPQNGGAQCSGPSRQEVDCEGDTCENGGWTEWSEYGTCCDRQQSRTRTCVAPASVGCVGESTQTIQCDTDECVKQYVPDFSRGVCVRANLANRRELQTTFPTIEGCCVENFSWNLVVCEKQDDTPIDGGWGEWTEFSRCCKNTQSSYRACDNPRPQNDGRPCLGEATQARECDTDECDGFTGGVASTGLSILAGLVFIGGLVVGEF